MITMSITVYSTPSCQQCRMTKKHLERKGLDYTEVDISTDDKAREYVLSQGFTQAPVVELENGEIFYGFRPDRLDAVAKQEVAA